MKITEDTLRVLIWNFAEVNVYSEYKGTDYYISLDGDSDYTVEYDVGLNSERHKRGTKTYHSFRNGDEDCPDMEGFLPMWVETLNASDCTVWISDTNRPKEVLRRIQQKRLR